jgi:MFS family permease
VFIKPLNEEFGWNRADILLGFSLSLLMLSGTAPFFGRLVDRFGARRVIVPSVLMFGSGVIQDLPGSEEYRREEWSLASSVKNLA